MTSPWTLLRAGTAVLILAAILTQGASTFTSALDAGRPLPATMINFVSFFTIDSNLLASAVLLWAAVLGVRAADDAATSRGLGAARVCAAAYMTVTGVVYNLLLRGIDLPQGTTVAWSNEVLHVLGPIVMLLDALIGPGARRLPWRAVWVVVAFPIVWVACTLVRGPFAINPATGQAPWYPYPFLDPGQVAGGAGGVALYVLGIAALMIGIGSALVAVQRRRALQVEQASPAAT